MYNKLARIEKLKNEWVVYNDNDQEVGRHNSLEAAEQADQKENKLINNVRDITDSFDINNQDFPTNLDVKIIENSKIKVKLYKLSSFLAGKNLSQENNEVIKLANHSASDEVNALEDDLKNKILDMLKEEYLGTFDNWSYEADFNIETFEFGFNDLERQFAIELMHDGLVSLEDLNLDEALEVLWAASGLTPEGHHDFDENLISLQNYQDKDLNAQSDHPMRDEVLEIKEAIVKKFSEWVEYRDPNFEDLEGSALEDLMSLAEEKHPSLKITIDDMRNKWKELSSSLLGDEQLSLEEDPVGTLGDLEDLFEKRLKDLREF